MTTTEARRETELLTAADLLRPDGEGVHGELIRGVLTGLTAWPSRSRKTR